MNKTMNSIYAVLSVIVVPLSGGCNLPYVEDVQMNIESIDFSGVRMAFDVSVVNPMDIDLTVPNGGYGVDIAGKSFVKSDSVPAMDLPSGGRSQFSVPVDLDYVKLFRIANNLKGKTEAPYELDGHLMIPIAGQEVSIPFSHKGDIPIMSLPTIEVRDVSFTGGKLALDIGVDNPNAFPIGIEDLGYTASLGSTDLGALRAAAADEIPAESSGTVTLSAALSAGAAARQLMQGSALGAVKVKPTGRLRTPYGAVPLP